MIFKLLPKNRLPIKAFYNLLLVIFLTAVLSACQTAAKNRITQISVIDALLAGHYDGIVTLQELSKHGDFGIGTFDRLDGEMVFVDGTFYQIKADGKVYKPMSSITTPFASVSWFNTKNTFTVQTETDYAVFQEMIDSSINNLNLFIAIKARGTFSFIKTRSVPAQAKPYPPLSAVASKQPVFTKKNTTGMLIGYRCPYFVRAINVPEYHLHFLSDDMEFGGHVLEFTMTHGTVETDIYNDFRMILPQDSSFAEIDFAKDRKDELEQVEK